MRGSPVTPHTMSEVRPAPRRHLRLFPPRRAQCIADRALGHWCPSLRLSRYPGATCASREFSRNRTRARYDQPRLTNLREVGCVVTAAPLLL